MNSIETNLENIARSLDCIARALEFANATRLKEEVKAVVEAVETKQEVAKKPVDIARALVIEDLKAKGQVVDLKQSTANLLKKLNALEAKPEEKAEKIKPVAAPVAPAKKEDKVDVDGLREILKVFAQKHTPNKVMELLQKYNAKKISELTFENSKLLESDVLNYETGVASAEQEFTF